MLRGHGGGGSAAGLLLKRGPLGLVLENEREQVGMQVKRSTWVLRRITVMHILRSKGRSLSLTQKLHLGKE